MPDALDSILFVLTLTASLSSAYAQQALAQQGFAAEVFPSDVTICKGEPFMLTFVATNFSTQTAKIRVDPRSFSYRIIPTKGQDNNLLFRLRTPPDYCSMPPRTFAPRQTLEVLVALPFFMHVAEGHVADTLSWRDMDFPPGEYSVVCYAYLDDAEPRQPPLETRVHVAVLPKDEKRLQERYRELAEMVADYWARERMRQCCSALTPQLLLDEIRDPLAVPIIAELLENDNPGVRLHAINALRNIPTPECLEALQKYERSRKLTPFNRWYLSKSIEGIKQRIEERP